MRRLVRAEHRLVDPTVMIFMFVCRVEKHRLKIVRVHGSTQLPAQTFPAKKGMPLVAWSEGQPIPYAKGFSVERGSRGLTDSNADMKKLGLTHI